MFWVFLGTEEKNISIFELWGRSLKFKGGNEDKRAKIEILRSELWGQSF